MTTAGQYGGLKYESPTARALGTITDEDYQKVYDDQAALTSKLVNDVSFMAANLRKVQQQQDQADENVIQQLQDFVNDIQVIMGGQGDTGFDFGDFKYVLEAYGALFDFIGPDGQIQTPVNLDAAMTNFFNQYLFGGQNWQQAFDSSTDSEIATMLDIMGEVPVLNQAAEQLAVILSKNRDDIDTIANVFNTFFSAFNIPPGGTFDLADFMNATNTLYTGLESLFSDVNFGSFQPVFEQMSRWDQQVMDAITQLSEGNLQGLLGLIPISSLTNTEPNLQPESDFADSDSIAANNAGWSWDGSVGNNALGSAKVICDGTNKGMSGEAIAIDEGQTLNPQVMIRWSGVTSTGTCVQLLIRANNGVDYIVQQTALSGANGGWVKLSGSWTDPFASGITSAKVRFVVTSAVTAGTIWFDDAPNTVSGTLIPQDWINGLTDQWNAFLASMGFDSMGDYIGASPETVWTTWYNEVIADLNLFLTPTSTLDSSFFSGDIWANFLGLFGITPDDLTGTGIDWNAIWTDISNDFLLPAGQVAPITAQNWLNRFIQDESIIWDIFGTIYQQGSVSDPPGTLGTNGKPTRYSAINDLAQLLGLAKGTATPAASVAPVGARIVAAETMTQSVSDAVGQGITNNTSVGLQPTDVKAVVNGLSSSVTAVQSQLVAVQNALPSQTPLGTKMSDSGLGSNASTWPNFTLHGSLPVGTANDFHANISGSTARSVLGIYNVAPTLTDYQVVDIVLSASPDTNFNTASSGFGALARVDSPSNPQNYIYYRYRATNTVEIGYYLAGVQHVLATFTGVTLAANSKWRLLVGITGNTGSVAVYQNAFLIGSANAPSAAIGAGYRYTGQAMWSDVAYSTELSPGKFDLFSMQDNAPSGIVGTYLQAQSGGSYVSLASGANNLPNGFFILQENSPDVTMDTNGLITIGKDGTYIFFVKMLFQTAIPYNMGAQVALVKNGVTSDSGSPHQGGYSTSLINQFNEVFFIPCSALDTITLLTVFSQAENCAGVIKVSRIGN